MKQQILKPGTHGSIVTTVPTRIKATKRWEALVATPDHFGVYAKAPTEVRGVRFGYAASCAIRANSHSNPSLNLRDVWIHGSPVAGLLSYGKVSARHVLAEMNGLNPQFEHGFYLASEFHLRQSIFWFNGGYQVHCYNEDNFQMVRGTIDRCLIVGPRAIAICSPHVRITNSTIVGEVSISNGAVLPVTGQDGNLVLFSQLNLSQRFSR